ncbi:MAG: DUF1365 domain-containing protein [Pseudomonadota bacterium]
MSETPEAGAIYAGHVMHMRLRPRSHRFRYRHFAFLLDVDRLAETAGSLRLLSANRFNLFAHHDADHGPRDGAPLRPWVEARLAEAGRPRPARIRLMAMPRVLGYVFNPLSVYYCEDAEGRLESLVYEVKNTFGGQIAYVVDASGPDGAARRHRAGKAMFVSPFIDMDQTYRFDVMPPAERLSIRIKQGDAEGDLLIATQSGDRRRLSDRALTRLAVEFPLGALRVILAIHWQALLLALKGAPFRRYPGTPNAFSRRKDRDAAGSGVDPALADPRPAV